METEGRSYGPVFHKDSAGRVRWTRTENLNPNPGKITWQILPCHEHTRVIRPSRQCPFSPEQYPAWLLTWVTWEMGAKSTSCSGVTGRRAHFVPGLSVVKTLRAWGKEFWWHFCFALFCFLNKSDFVGTIVKCSKHVSVRDDREQCGLKMESEYWTCYWLLQRIKWSSRAKCSVLILY